MRSPRFLSISLAAGLFTAASLAADAQAQENASAPRTSAFVARGDLVSAELASFDPGRQLATTVTINAYSGLAMPGEEGGTPRRLVVVIDRRQAATSTPILFAVGTAASFELEAGNGGSAMLRASVPMYALDGQHLFDVAVDLAFAAGQRPRAIHWINPFNVPGFSSVFHALDVASEASVAGRVAFGDANFTPQHGRGVLALGARVIVGIVPGQRGPQRAASTAPAAAPAAPAAPSAPAQPAAPAGWAAQAPPQAPPPYGPPQQQLPQWTPMPAAQPWAPSPQPPQGWGPQPPPAQWAPQHAAQPWMPSPQPPQAPMPQQAPQAPPQQAPMPQAPPAPPQQAPMPPGYPWGMAPGQGR